MDFPLIPMTQTYSEEQQTLGHPDDSACVKILFKTFTFLINAILKADSLFFKWYLSWCYIIVSVVVCFINYYYTCVSDYYPTSLKVVESRLSYCKIIVHLSAILLVLCDKYEGPPLPYKELPSLSSGAQLFY